MVAVLPQALRNELHDALESLESERINTVLQQVKPLDATLYQTLSGLVDNFDYPSVLKALQTSQTELGSLKPRVSEQGVQK